MKKLSLTLMVLALFVTFMFCSCGGGNNKGPANISMKLWEQVQKENYKKAAEIWYDNADFGEKAAEAEAAKEESITLLSSKLEESRANQPKITNVKMVKEEIDEEQGEASVTVLLTYDNGEEDEETDKYKKVDGAWKIDASAK